MLKYNSMLFKIFYFKLEFIYYIITFFKSKNRIMKKIYSFSLVILCTLLTFQVFAQSKRMAFIEEATQASCGPCASANPNIQALVNENSENTIFLAYQVWWPGFDQMYLDNPTDVDVRVGEYYLYEFAPQVVLQGDFVGEDGSASGLTQATLDEITEQDAEFDMEISGEVVNGVLHVTGTVTASVAVEGDLKLRIMLAEELITIEDAPGGSNGETEYHHVFKAFVGGVDGIEVAASWAAGDTYTIDEELNLSDYVIYHFGGLEVFAIIQNDADKFVHQAAADHEIDVTVSFATNGAAIEVLGLPADACPGDQSISPAFVLQNGGNDDLVSADIVYSINGGAEQTYNWTGTIETLGTEDVTLDPIAFTAGATNTVEITVTNPNGGTDENAADDTTSGSFGLANSTDGITLTMTLNTDCWPEENTWELRDGSGIVVASGGPYTDQAETEIIEEITIENVDDCFDFVFTDSYGDGLHGGQFSDCDTDGNITLADEAGNTLYSYDGSYDTSEDLGRFSKTILVGTEDLIFDATITVTPNPVVSKTTVNFGLQTSTLTLLSVVTVTGQEVMNINLGTLSAGRHAQEIDMSDLSNGVYFIRLSADKAITTQRVVLAK